MEIKKIKTKVYGSDCELDVMEFDKSDGKEWKNLFDLWINLKLGLRSYKSREPNIPEGISEIAFCLWSKSVRFVKIKGSSSSSFDTFNLKTGKAEQIKASSVKSDLTSFGPKSKWDDIYFLDFFNGGKLDGTFSVYKIPIELIPKVKVNKRQTFAEQQAQGKRPRFSLMDKLILPMKINPLAKNVRVW